jgi:hypothetical protein
LWRAAFVFGKPWGNFLQAALALLQPTRKISSERGRDQNLRALRAFSRESVMAIEAAETTDIVVKFGLRRPDLISTQAFSPIGWHPRAQIRQIGPF